jgi:hypothetical protein
MIDHDLSHRLHSLAATLDEPLDLVALHRRISIQSRRRAAAKVGVAGVGVAAVVGGLFVVRDQRSGPAQSGFASTPAESSEASSASSPSSSSMEQPSALPECATVLAALQTAETGVPKDVPTDPSSSADELGERGFKGIVTITAVDGQQLSFDVEEPEIALPSSGLGTLDEATEWFDGATMLTTPPVLAVGEQLGLATKPNEEGVDHVLFVDLGAVDYEGKPDKVDKPTTDGAPLTSDQLDKLADATTPSSEKVLPPGVDATEPATAEPGQAQKAQATITAADAATLTATLDDREEQTAPFTIDLATTPFSVDDRLCAPGALAVGTEINLAYHLDETGNVVADAVGLMP